MTKANLYIVLLAAIILSTWSCKNQEITFDDFDYTAVYFPIQTPLRTLVLGEDRIDNSLDKQLKFNVGVSIGGLYSNNRSWAVDIDFAPDLAANLQNENGDTLMMLPVEYIQATSPSIPGGTTIPSGEFNGLFEFTLEDNFLDDPMAYTGQYFIPLRITNTEADSILTGVPAVDNPDKRIADNWDVSNPPKDFTLFGIKFINDWHGSWLHRGKTVETDENGNVVNTNVYSSNFITQNEIWSLATRGRDVVVTNGIGQNIGDGNGMTLIVSGTNVKIEPLDGAAFEVSGSGTFIPSTESTEVWGEQSRNALYINYSYIDGGNTFSATDTLVLRDRDVKYEELSISVVD